MKPIHGPLCGQVPVEHQEIAHQPHGTASSLPVLVQPVVVSVRGLYKVGVVYLATGPRLSTGRQHLIIHVHDHNLLGLKLRVIIIPYRLRKAALDLGLVFAGHETAQDDAEAPFHLFFNQPPEADTVPLVPPVVVAVLALTQSFEVVSLGFFVVDITQGGASIILYCER